MALEQKTRLLQLTTPLGDNQLLLTGFSGHEEISRLFRFQLEMISDNGAIKPDEIVGKNVTFSVEMTDGSRRYFNGFVSRFMAGDEEQGRRNYRADVVPWLWFLTQTTDCRIFQEKKVPDIIKQIFEDLGFKDFKLDIKGSHKTWEYCVQYRESDFNFVSRLMEQEGIYFFFQHEKGTHTLIISDHKGAYLDCHEKEVDFPLTIGQMAIKDRITSWTHQYEFRPGKWAHTDYNFKTPSTNLMTKSTSLVKMPGMDKYEVYDYPGEFADKSEGEAEVKWRMEEEEAAHDTVQGSSGCKSFFPGGKFKVKVHRSPSEEGKSYVITSVFHSANEPLAYESGGVQVDADYTNNFTSIPDSVVFRPARITSKPIISGAQTAVVTGPPGEEIYVDEFGRVKVQFHWDREGKKDEKTSCWVRVSQYWAGQTWGSMHIPHIGQEAIVSFLEGDPDRPIITGRVYNAEQKVPLPLPAEKTKSIQRDYGGNETIIEGKDGSQFIHTKQTCGNEMLMDGTTGKEKIEIRDKYGNEVVLDAVAGTIRIYSPTHTSEIVLGRSINMFSQSHLIGEFLGNEVFTVHGDEFAKLNGSKHENVIGYSSKFIGGWKNEIVVGIETKVNKGNKSELVVGSQIKVQRGSLLELKGSPRTEKVPRTVKAIGFCLSKMGQLKHVVNGAYHSAVSAAAYAKWKSLDEKGESGKYNFKTGKFLVEELLEKGDKHAVKCVDAQMKASEYKVLAKMEVKNGALVVS